MPQPRSTRHSGWRHSTWPTRCGCPRRPRLRSRGPCQARHCRSSRGCRPTTCRQGRTGAGRCVAAGELRIRPAPPARRGCGRAASSRAAPPVNASALPSAPNAAANLLRGDAGGHAVFRADRPAMDLQRRVDGPRRAERVSITETVGAPFHVQASPARRRTRPATAADAGPARMGSCTPAATSCSRSSASGSTGAGRCDGQERRRVGRRDVERRQPAGIHVEALQSGRPLCGPPTAVVSAKRHMSGGPDRVAQQDVLAGRRSTPARTSPFRVSASGVQKRGSSVGKGETRRSAGDRGVRAEASSRRPPIRARPPAEPAAARGRPAPWRPRAAARTGRSLSRRSRRRRASGRPGRPLVRGLRPVTPVRRRTSASVDGRPRRPGTTGRRGPMRTGSCGRPASRPGRCSWLAADDAVTRSRPSATSKTTMSDGPSRRRRSTASASAVGRPAGRAERRAAVGGDGDAQRAQREPPARVARPS